MKHKIIAAMCCGLFITLSVPANAQNEAEAPSCLYSQTLSIAPAIINNTGPGVGISYEHTLDDRGRFAFNADVYAAFSKSKWHYSDYYRTTCMGTLLSFRYYTAPCERKVRYALGFGIPLDILSRKTSEGRSPGGYSKQDRTDMYFRTGIAFHNSLQFNVSRRVAIGLNANLGFAGSDEENGDSFAPYALLLATVGCRL